MRIGFQLPDAEEVEPEVGAADPDDAGPPFHEGLFDFLPFRLLARTLDQICYSLWVICGNSRFDKMYLRWRKGPVKS